MGELENRKIRSDMIVSWLSLVGVAAAVIFGLMQYAEASSGKLKDTQRATLGFVERYNQSEILVARRNVSEALAALWRAADNEGSAVVSHEQAEDERKRFYEDNAVKFLRDGDAYFDAILLIRFFDELFTCIDFHICDKKSADRFFYDEANQLNYALKYEIARIRTTQLFFGDGIAALAVLEWS